MGNSKPSQEPSPQVTALEFLGTHWAQSGPVHWSLSNANSELKNEPGHRTRVQAVRQGLKAGALSFFNNFCFLIQNKKFPYEKLGDLNTKIS